MRLGLIGLGRIGAFHARTLAALPAVETLVVTDPDPGALAAVGAAVGAEPVPDLDALLGAGIDGLVIAASTAAHPALIRAGAAAGLPVFCEKPVAGELADAVALVRELAGATVQIGFPRRFDAGFVAARAAVAGGELGDLLTIRSTTLDPSPPPAAYIAVSGGIFHDCVVHDIDAVRWVSGREVVEAYATGGNRGADYIAAAGDVDTCAAVLTLDDGTLALVSGTRHNPRGYDVRLELHGSRDSVAAGLDDRLPLRSVEPGATFPAGPPHTFFLDRFAAAFRAELAAFTEVVAGTRPSPCPLEDAVRSSRVAEACTRSLREHRPVRPAEIE